MTENDKEIGKMITTGESGSNEDKIHKNSHNWMKK